MKVNKNKSIKDNYSICKKQYKRQTNKSNIMRKKQKIKMCNY